MTYPVLYQYRIYKMTTSIIDNKSFVDRLRIKFIFEDDDNEEKEQIKNRRNKKNKRIEKITIEEDRNKHEEEHREEHEEKHGEEHGEEHREEHEEEHGEEHGEEYAKEGTEGDNTEEETEGIVEENIDKNKEEETENTCYNCGGTDCFDESELITCILCGTIQDRPFDSKVEYRMFSNDDRGSDPTRIGAPQDPTLPQSSLSTVILNHPHGGSGGRGRGRGRGRGGGSSGSNKDMYRIRKYHSWNTIPYKERALIQAYDRLTQVCSMNGINMAIIETAKNLYVTVKEVAGRSGVCRDAMLSACVYVGLKDSGSPRKPKDISEMFGITTTVFTKAMKKLQSILMMARQKGKISVSTAKRMEGTTTNASEYMLYPLSKLGISKTDQEFIYRMSLIIYEKISEMSFCQENMPPSLAGGCLAYIIDKFRSELETKMEITHKMIAEVCEISEATLDKCLKRIQENLMDDI